MSPCAVFRTGREIAAPLPDPNVELCAAVPQAEPLIHQALPRCDEVDLQDARGQAPSCARKGNRQCSGVVMELLYLDSHARGRERRGVDLATPDLRTWSRGTRSPKRKRHPAGVKNSYRRRRLAVRPPMENTGSPLADSECYDNFLRGT